MDVYYRLNTKVVEGKVRERAWAVVDTVPGVDILLIGSADSSEDFAPQDR
jgi:hypothetical protein